MTCELVNLYKTLNVLDFGQVQLFIINLIESWKVLWLKIQAFSRKTALTEARTRDLKRKLMQQKRSVM